MTTHAQNIDRHSFREEGQVVVITPVTDAREDEPGVGIPRPVLRAFVVRSVGEGFDAQPSALRSLLLTEADLPDAHLDPVGPEAITLAADGTVTIASANWNPRPHTARDARVQVPFASLLTYALNDLCEVMAGNIASANRRESVDIVLSLLGGTRKPVMPPGTGDAQEPREGVVPGSWGKPVVAQRAGYEELRESLDELRDAASSVYSELAGTRLHIRGHRRLEEMREPMRRSFCVLKGIPFVPKPVEEDAAVEPYIRAIEAVMGRSSERDGAPAH